ncbi:hypothetical protein CCR96_05725 [Halochromatium roseum]|nr:hypothetical protein [Halochromatium roseum]
MFFFANGLLLMGPESSMQSPGTGQGEQAEEVLEAFGLGQMGVFEVEAMALEGGKQGFDTPSQKPL